MAIESHPKSVTDFSPEVFWGRAKSNYFWGCRRGMIYRDGKGLYKNGCPAYKIKRGSINRKENTGPSGYKLRKTKVRF
jgi:hypothetical protein